MEKVDGDVVTLSNSTFEQKKWWDINIELYSPS